MWPSGECPNIARVEIPIARAHYLPTYILKRTRLTSRDRCFENTTTRKNRQLAEPAGSDRQRNNRDRHKMTGFLIETSEHGTCGIGKGDVHRPSPGFVNGGF